MADAENLAHRPELIKHAHCVGVIKTFGNRVVDCDEQHLVEAKANSGTNTLQLVLQNVLVHLLGPNIDSRNRPL